MCKKYGSYKCRATLRNFVGNISTLEFCKKDSFTWSNVWKQFPTSVGTVPTSVGTVPTSERTVPTSVGTVPTSVGIVPTCVRIIPALIEFCRNYSCTAKSLTLCAMCI